jgi:hypothetical protein
MSKRSLESPSFEEKDPKQQFVNPSEESTRPFYFVGSWCDGLQMTRTGDTIVLPSLNNVYDNMSVPLNAPWVKILFPIENATNSTRKFQRCFTDHTATGLSLTTSAQGMYDASMQLNAISAYVENFSKPCSKWFAEGEGLVAIDKAPKVCNGFMDAKEKESDFFDSFSTMPNPFDRRGQYKTAHLLQGLRLAFFLSNEDSSRRLSIPLIPGMELFHGTSVVHSLNPEPSNDVESYIDTHWGVILESLPVGGRFTVPTPLSTTTHPCIALKFSSARYTSTDMVLRRYLLRLDVTSAALPRAISPAQLGFGHKPECELILQPGLEFELIHRQDLPEGACSQMVDGRGDLVEVPVDLKIQILRVRVVAVRAPFATSTPPVLIKPDVSEQPEKPPNWSTTGKPTKIAKKNYDLAMESFRAQVKVLKHAEKRLEAQRLSFPYVWDKETKSEVQSVSREEKSTV